MRDEHRGGGETKAPDRATAETRTLHFSSAFALRCGLLRLGQEGLRSAGLLFAAADEQGGAHLAFAEPPEMQSGGGSGTSIALALPFARRAFHFDAIHRLSPDTVLVNGDRRLGGIATLVDSAKLISDFAARDGDRSVFFGSAPHQPGSWWIHETRPLSLHDRGLFDVTPTPLGFVARRAMSDGLFFLLADAASRGAFDRWEQVFASPLGNVLLLERRLRRDRLTLSCQRGLVEVSLRDLPRVRQKAVLPLAGGQALVGRTTSGGWVVAQGSANPSGLVALRPGVIVGSRSGSLTELAAALAEKG